jgi:uncharacterized NAD(P)/FAD-binding protein YdhS
VDFFLRRSLANPIFPMSLSLDALLNKPASYSIAIIGGGASATLLLHNLSKNLSYNQTCTDIYLIDEKAGLQFGQAYSIREPIFLLNVPAINMGADVDEPDGFYRWIERYPERWRYLNPAFNELAIGPQDFAPRMIYAEYLRDLLGNAKLQLQRQNIAVHLLHARVIGIDTLEHSNLLQLRTNTHLQLIVNTAVLCTGNTLPNHADKPQAHATSPYCENFLSKEWQQVKNVAVLGSGLCMVDAIQYLSAKGFKGQIHAFSRQGLIPQPHSPTPATKAPDFNISEITSAHAAIKNLKREIKKNTLAGIGWQETINSFRQQTNRLWLQLAPSERKRLRRFMPWWNVTRHRISETAYQQLTQLLASGKLTLIKGIVQKAECDGEYLLAHMNSKIIVVQAEHLILCSGYTCNYPQLKLLCSALLDIPQLQRKLNCRHPNYQVSDTHQIYALGPALTGVLFETTAIHEIRHQCAAIAAQLALPITQR